MTTTRSGRNSLPTLWEQALTLWQELVAGFGRPVDLMRWGVMRALEHRALGQWLRDLEAIVRKAIRRDAGELELPELKPVAPRPMQPAQLPRKNTPRFHAPVADEPWTWKVSFSMHPPAPRMGKSSRKEPAENRPCRNYAFRIEALRRAIAQRDAFVRRYAMRLARIAEANLRAVREQMRACIASHPATLAAASHDAARTAASEATPQIAKHFEPG